MPYLIVDVINTLAPLLPSGAFEFVQSDHYRLVKTDFGFRLLYPTLTSPVPNSFMDSCVSVVTDDSLDDWIDELELALNATEKSD